VLGTHSRQEKFRPQQDLSLQSLIKRKIDIPGQGGINQLVLIDIRYALVPKFYNSFHQ